MTPIDSTNDENICVSYLRLYLHLNDQTTYQRKNLKLPYLHCYTRSIPEIWRVETWMYWEMNVLFGKCRKFLEHGIYSE